MIDELSLHEDIKKLCYKYLDNKISKDEYHDKLYNIFLSYRDMINNFEELIKYADMILLKIQEKEHK
jgi:hypothetical protein